MFGRGRPARCAGRVLPVLMIVVMLGSCGAPARHPAGGSSASPATHGRLAVSVRLGGEVDGLAAGGGYLWAYVRDTGVLVRVDQRTGQARRFVLGAWRGMPGGVAAGPHGLWLGNQHGARPALVLMDPGTGRAGARPGAPARRRPGSCPAAPARLPAWQPPTGRCGSWCLAAPSRPDGECCA